VTTAVPEYRVLAFAVAVIVISAGFGTLAGAVNSPFAVIVPQSVVGVHDVPLILHSTF
jgi:uncharacterized ion transporter superfamily protein YfcC